LNLILFFYLKLRISFDCPTPVFSYDLDEINAAKG